jgi:hypothetical protein
MSEQHDNIKNLLDLAAVFTTLGTFLNLLTPIFGLIGAVVGIMRIVEMSTGKEFVDVLPWKKKAKDDAVNK